MTKAKRGRGSRHGVYLCALAALGLALSGCGDSVGRSMAGASAAASSQPTGSPVSGQDPTTAQSSASSQDSTPAQSTSPGSGTATDTASSGGSPPAATAGAVTINWTPPTENVDGSALTNLAGYNIHYGTAAGNYAQTISISNPGIATYVVSNLTPGTYYFTVAAINSSGTESPLSSEVSVKVN